jgi:prepilin-type processing-associated H-X9-DG protein
VLHEYDGHYIEDGYFYKPNHERNVAFADGQVRYVRMPLERDLAIALLSIEGGEKIDVAMLDRLAEPELDYMKCYVFGLFVLITLLPTPWAYRRGMQHHRVGPI